MSFKSTTFHIELAERKYLDPFEKGTFWKLQGAKKGYVEIYSKDGRSKEFQGYEYTKSGKATGNGWCYWVNGVFQGSEYAPKEPMHLEYPYVQVNSTGTPLKGDKKTAKTVKVAKKNINDIWTL